MLPRCRHSSNKLITAVASTTVGATCHRLPLASSKKLGANSAGVSAASGE